MLCFKSKSLPYLNSATVIIYQAACKYTLVKIYLQYEQINFYKGRDILREINRVTNIFLFILTGLQCSESIWFHGEHFLGRKNKFLWEESSRISEVRSNEQKVIYYIRTCIQNRWKFLNLFRVYHKNGERILFKKKYQKFEQNHMLTLRLYIFPCCCQHCINKLDCFS